MLDLDLGAIAYDVGLARRTLELAHHEMAFPDATSELVEGAVQLVINCLQAFQDRLDAADTAHQIVPKVIR